MSQGDEAEIPAYLYSTWRMLHDAYGESVPDEDYLPLLQLLEPHMSNRALASTLALLGREYIVVWNDVQRVSATSPVPREELTRVKERLPGYDRWVVSDS